MTTLRTRAQRVHLPIWSDCDETGHRADAALAMPNTQRKVVPELFAIAEVAFLRSGTADRITSSAIALDGGWAAR